MGFDPNAINLASTIKDWAIHFVQDQSVVSIMGIAAKKNQDIINKEHFYFFISNNTIQLLRCPSVCE